MCKEKMVGFLYWLSKYLTFLAIIYLLKSQARQKMEYWCLIWEGAGQSLLFNVDRVQKRSTSLYVTNYFLPHSPFLTDESLQNSRCSIAISKEYVKTKYIT